MKKTYKSSLLALSVLASFTSCSESESLQQANLSKDKITFHATLDNSWKPMSPASSSRAAIAAATEKGPIVVPTPFGKPLYLHSVVQDGIHIWSKEGKPITRSGAPLEDVEHERVAQTRGTMSTKIGDYGSFGVTAIYKEGDNNVLLLDNAEAENTDGEFWGITNNSNARWPMDCTVSFHAYAPHSSADKSQLTYGVDKDNVQTQITYTASTTADDIINQPDLIVATNTGSRQLSDADDAVQLDFYHALTAVSFAIDKDLADVVGQGGKMTSVTLKGIPNKGNCNLSVSATANVPTADWTVKNERVDYTFDLTDKNIIVGEKDQALTSDNQTLMMIPQTLPEGAELCFSLDMNGTTQEWKVPLKGQVWEAGKSIIYKLSSNSINMLDDAKIVYPGTWTAHSFPKKSFGENDVVGLYVVNKFNQIVAENVQLTKTKGEENSFTWKTKDNKNFSFSPDNRYFAYYPYSATMTKGEGTVTTATDFFKTKISSLANDDNVVADQSDKEVLLAQDFQVATGTVGPEAGSIVFNMEHQVGLAVLNLNEKEIAEYRQFTDDSYMYYYGKKDNAPTNFNSIGAKTLRASNNFDGNKPYIVPSENKCLQIIPFNQKLSFKAKDQESSPRTAWGYDKAYSVTLKSSSPVVTDITVDAEYYKLARLFSFKGSTESFTVPVDGTYTLECWGAGESQGGKSCGDYQAPKNQVLYICVGGKGSEGDRAQIGIGGYNGGGNGGSAVVNDKGQPLKRGDGGSGATHICLVDGVLSNLKTAYENNQLLMVAGGQGGAQYKPTCPGLFGGGREGGRPTNSAGPTFDAANQLTGYAFGQGQTGRDGTIKTQNGGEGNGGGGGGLYGGYSPQVPGNKTNSPGGGGSGYVNPQLVNAETIAGNQSFLSPSGVSETGHAGDGAALITWLP